MRAADVRAPGRLALCLVCSVVWLEADPGADPASPNARVGPQRSAGQAAPVIVEDFSSYSSTDDLLSDPRDLYIESHHEEFIELDRSIGLWFFGLNQSMRYDFDGVNSVMRRLAIPRADEVWIEAWVRFSPSFRTDWGKDGNPDYKFIFAVTDPSRFQLKTGTSGRSYTVGSPAEGAVGRHASSNRDWDGRWHRYRLHFSHESWEGACDGTARAWVDWNRHFGRRGDVCTRRDAGRMWSVKLGANHNQTPEEIVQIWWGRIAIWTEDPGW